MAVNSDNCQFPGCEKIRDLKRRSSLCAMHRVRRGRHKMTKLEDKIFAEINRNSKSKGKICLITNCNTPVYSHGRICSKHHWRFRKYGQYDLPDYKGKPNVIEKIEFPIGIVKKCRKHGYLTIDQVYERFHKKVPNYACKECLIAKNIEKKYKGVLGLEDYERILSKQNGKCIICKSDQNNTTRNGKIKRFNIDHCHKTGKVRGLLCSFCNSLLGYAKDDINILQSAINYLESNK